MRTSLIVLLTLAACANGPSSTEPDEPAPVCLEAPGACEEESLVFDNDGDGEPDLSVTTVIGEHGPIRTSTDVDGDGALDAVELRTYDDLGRLTRVETDLGVDGTIDAADVWSWSDAPFEWVLYRDDGNDGIINVREVHTFNEDDRLVQLEVDHTNDGVFEDVTRYEYDGNGNLTARRYDAGNDDIEDVIERTRYDDQGRIVYQGTQFDEAGPATQWTTWAYDTCGRIITRIDVTIRTDRVDRAYDAAGRLETEVFDTYADGIADYLWLYSYDGLNQTAELAFANDGTINTRVQRELDEAGRTVFESYDDGADGTVESSWWAERTCPS